MYHRIKPTKQNLSFLFPWPRNQSLAEKDITLGFSAAFSGFLSPI